MIELGTFLKRVKRRVELDPDTSYKLITIKLYQKGVFLRGEKLGRDIKSPMSVVHAGDFVLSGIDARSGAFGIVPKELHGAIITNDFWCLDVDESHVLKQLFLELTKVTWFRRICQACSSGTTQRIRLDKELFFNHCINLPDRDEQSPCLDKILRLKGAMAMIYSEHDKQQKWLSDLRSALLQEAISGELTADWRAANPDVEPAHALLERIAQAKAELIRTKQIRKEKPLPPINPDEVPFDIPSSWDWARLGTIAFNFDHLRVPLKKADRDSQASLFDYYGASGIIDAVEGFTHDGNFLLIGEDGSNLRSRNHPIAFHARGKFWLNNHAHALQFKCDGLTEFVRQVIAGSNISDFVTGGFQPKLSKGNMNRIPIPFPPFEEQQEIVRRLEMQLEKLDALKLELKQFGLGAQLLESSILEEVLRQSKETTEELL